ncbi:transcriptional regulator, LysR family [Thalassoporum mexicanum PCC 7367]|uniref:LysR family transcriptional regulator n=1 Tax=Thalassoporum mexicanum TaxID=3457544 RepID=UPI00029FB554|nr:LysR family transcriptional regulator [Pseudanabaena sp. PCC 7367]AFY69572.1 transcriptional regulator, LysR family [Pseudanabaena sp. PCC 7367]
MHGNNLLNHNQVKLSQIRAFVAVAESGSFGEAALNLEISQSAISHAIAALEEQLGVVLLNRGRHGAILTPIGKQLLDYAENILRSLEEMTQTANQAKGLQNGEVRLVAFRSAAAYILPAIIVDFRQKFPGIKVRIIEHDDDQEVEQTLRQGYADIGITHLPTGEGFLSWPLLRDEYIAIFPPDYCPKHRVKNNHISWEDLTTYPLISVPQNNTCGILIRKHLEAQHQKLNVAYVVREDSTIIRMVSQGLGSTILARLAAQPIPSELQTYSLPVPLYRQIGVTMRENAMQVPAVYAFLDMLRSYDIAQLAYSKNYLKASLTA